MTFQQVSPTVVLYGTDRRRFCLPNRTGANHFGLGLRPQHARHHLAGYIARSVHRPRTKLPKTQFKIGFDVMAQSPTAHAVTGGQPGAAVVPLAIGPVPNVYFNGFALGLAPADASLLVTLDGHPQIRLSMSFTTAKTLSAYLQKLIERLETVTNHTIMKTDEVEAGLRKIEKESAENV